MRFQQHQAFFSQNEGLLIKPISLQTRLSSSTRFSFTKNTKHSDSTSILQQSKPFIIENSSNKHQKIRINCDNMRFASNHISTKKEKDNSLSDIDIRCEELADESFSDLTSNIKNYIIFLMKLELVNTTLKEDQAKYQSRVNTPLENKASSHTLIKARSQLGRRQEHENQLRPTTSNTGKGLLTGSHLKFMNNKIQFKMSIQNNQMQQNFFQVSGKSVFNDRQMQNSPTLQTKVVQEQDRQTNKVTLHQMFTGQQFRKYNRTLK